MNKQKTTDVGVVMKGGFKPITFNEFSKSCGETWDSVLEQQPNTPLHDPDYPIHWQIWVKAQIEERFFCKPRKHVMKELMQESGGKLNPKWISQFCCPACDGTGEFDVDGEESEQCLNCDGCGWLIHLEVE